MDKRILTGFLIAALAVAAPVSAQNMDAATAQQALTALGYDIGPVDGQLGPRSEDALRLFQSAEGLPVTGSLDAATVAALAPTMPTPGDTVEAPEPASEAPEEPGWTAIVIVLVLIAVVFRGVFLLIRWIFRGISGLFRRAPKKDTSRPRRKREPNITPPPEASASVLTQRIDPVADQVEDATYTLSETSIPVPDPAQPEVTRPPRTRQRNASGWVPPVENVTVAGRDIGGMVYVGSPPKDGRYGEPDNAFIDPSRPVGRHGGDWDGHDLSYWPNYAHLSPLARATYLNWLAEGRTRAVNPGYMFLYFYGLERRYFRETPGDDERRLLVAEVKRLRDLFGENRSASRYLGAFLDAAALEQGGDTTPVASPGEVSIALKVGLARRVEAQHPLDAPWLRAWYLSDSETRLRTPARRCGPEFAALFDAIFAREYPKGLPLRRPKRKLEASYHAASGRFEADLSGIVGDLRDVTSLRKPLTTAATIAEEATAALEGFSRLLGKDADARGTLAAHAMLPAEIRDQFPCVEADALAEWLRSCIAQGGQVDALDLLERLTGARPDKLTRKRLTDASDTLLRLGVGMAPDPRFALRAPKVGEPVILFDLPADTHALAVSDGFRAAALRIGIATMIAQADDTVDDAEAASIDAIVSETPGLSTPERLRLSATARWMRAVPPDMALLRKRMKDAPVPAREAFAALAVDMAAADGEASPEEIAQLEKLYKALGLDPSGLYGALHGAMSGASDDPITMRPAAPAPDGPAIPPERVAAPGGIGLDMGKVASIGADTRDVSTLLGSIFAGDEPEEELEAAAPSDPATLPGLTPAQTALARELVTRDHWSEAEFEAAATRHGLMPAGAVEAINDWAFAVHERAYLDEFDGYDIDPDIAAEIGD